MCNIARYKRIIAVNLRMKLYNAENPNLLINGLYMDESQITVKNGTFVYDQLQLQNLLFIHEETVNKKLIDELFLELDTIEVLEYNGTAYAVQVSNN